MPSRDHPAGGLAVRLLPLRRTLGSAGPQFTPRERIPRQIADGLLGMPAAAVLGATAVRTAEAGTPATGAAPAAARYDVIVIGAGISGLSAARYLSDRDEDRSEVIPAEVRRAGPARDRRGRNPSCRPAHPDITGAHGKQVRRDVREPLRKTYVIVPVPGGERSGRGRHGGPEPSAAERD